MIVLLAKHLSSISQPNNLEIKFQQHFKGAVFKFVSFAHPQLIPI
jgi:hypothetical protein